MGALKVNDKVVWRGAWGTQSPQVATVTRIEVCEPGCKHGDPVAIIPWHMVTGRNVVVDLSTGNWAYGFQISPAEPPQLEVVA